MKVVTLKNGDTFPSLIRGLWQVSKGHQDDSGNHDPLKFIQNSVEMGFSTFDCADIYTGAEDLLGAAKAVLEKNSLRVHTKYVPDRDQLSGIQKVYTRDIIHRSLNRLKMDQLDLVQFHWWDYEIPFYLEALGHLADLQKEGKIRAIGLTNFDTPHVEEILKNGFQIETIQLQASLVDRRAQRAMKVLCEKNQIKRLAYGTLLGGFLSLKWLGQSEPSTQELSNRSLIKYKLMIDDWGGWARFQSLLLQLSDITKRYGLPFCGQIAVQAVLQGGLADAAIVGLSPQNHQAQNQELLLPITLEKEDLDALLAWTCPLVGDVYELERMEKHGSIMKTNLNQK